VTRRTPARGFSLLEVLVALILLEVCLLGVVGLFTLASRRLARALLVERAAAEVGAVADSLSRAGGGESGESAHGEWRLSWEPGSGAGLIVRASLLADAERTAVVGVRLP
jgi:prepilin-type N-terminal cleavage/methylation domain-containing protein